MTKQIEEIKAIHKWLSNESNQELIQGKWNAAIKKSQGMTTNKREPFIELEKYLYTLLREDTIVVIDMKKRTISSTVDFDQLLDVYLDFEWKGKDQTIVLYRQTYSEHRNDKIPFDYIVGSLPVQLKAITNIDINE